MRKIFLADAHLQHPADDGYRRLLRFIDTLSGTTDTLYILGDLFQFAIGYHPAAFPHYRPMLEALRRLAESGTRIVYLEGNHDFLLKRFLSDVPQLKLHAEPVDLTIDGRHVHLCHGDAINRSDRRYRITRRILRSVLVRVLLRLVPAGGAEWIAREMAHRSRKAHHRNDRLWDPPALIRTYAGAQLERGCDLVITGHYHRPFLERREAGTIVSLGDWITQFSYAVLENGEVSLEVYSG